MKKVKKFKRIVQKTRHIKSSHLKRNISRKISIRKKYLLQQIESPHNTNEYLINNQSSPFFVDDEEDSITIEPNSVIHMESENLDGMDLFSLKDWDSTNEESMILNEKTESEKEEIEKCLKEKK
jgi:hypothetical protein